MGYTVDGSPLALTPVYVSTAQCCLERLQGFTITAAPWSITDTPYSYTDPGGPPQNIYTVVPSPRISFPVTQVRLEKDRSGIYFSVCEVKVFGENACPERTFGLRCERKCSCVDQENCFVHSGGCPFGCAKGFIGETCSDCMRGLYGDKCHLRCSKSCAGDGSCNQQDGSCKQCGPGFTGPTCETPCPRGTFGPECRNNCSDQCAGTYTPCHYMDGACYLGCRQWNDSSICIELAEDLRGRASATSLLILAVVTIASLFLIAVSLIVGVKGLRNQATDPAERAVTAHGAQQGAQQGAQRFAHVVQHVAHNAPVSPVLDIEEDDPATANASLESLRFGDSMMSNQPYSRTSLQSNLSEISYITDLE
ncbi:hypothetical protein EGW08_002685 [Elysia chlorotica]|uniref:Uncharacterized protein n=1 Tax=Elysia chlorotica TaxID=188477 RepID=A0A433U6X0_ELYCH|nr:hypothetical protein EGW08_002685 [Elysia chlorotica]